MSVLNKDYLLFLIKLMMYHAMIQKMIHIKKKLKKKIT
jgi:hypothetical protein